jgi:hypothetical protein
MQMQKMWNKFLETYLNSLEQWKVVWNYNLQQSEGV